VAESLFPVRGLREVGALKRTKEELSSDRFLFFFFFFAILGFELRAFTLSYSTSQSFFVKGVFKIGSHKLFAQGWLQTLDPSDLCLLSS
jgi:hypothetical protein